MKERGQSKVCKMESTSQTVSGQSVLETQEIQNKDYNKHKNQASWEKSKVEALVRGGGEKTHPSQECAYWDFLHAALAEVELQMILKHVLYAV